MRRKNPTWYPSNSVYNNTVLCLVISPLQLMTTHHTNYVSPQIPPCVYLPDLLCCQQGLSQCLDWLVSVVLSPTSLHGRMYPKKKKLQVKFDGPEVNTKSDGLEHNSTSSSLIPSKLE